MDANKLIELLVDDPRATVTDLADILNAPCELRFPVKAAIMTGT